MHKNSLHKVRLLFQADQGIILSMTTFMFYNKFSAMHLLSIIISI
jgi:hypothetical protein